MSNYITFINAHDIGTVTVTTHEESCGYVCQAFVDFMRAVGFSDRSIAEGMRGLDIMDEEIDKL